ncbi:cupredoxin domain-containing protein [Marinobacter halodurans]|uniref:Cupredoxin domain-containing protein n=1 Tax=Marinobacter halodurans TaxID=2528979 RepID=A0ABY1ZMN1_9GAMM|nr:cupredoxin domain-containing protein [Marinobacter halodurans]TBW57610.1 cupredoxin domain-containing protein [Marinobacter halodurans]
MTKRLLSAATLFLALATSLPAAAGLPSYDLELQDGKLNPEVIHVKAGERFKLNIRNTGQGPVEFESQRLRQEKVLAPGASSFVVIHPLKPGEYDFIDEFHLPDAKGRIVAE